MGELLHGASGAEGGAWRTMCSLENKVTSFWSESKASMTETNQCLAHFSCDPSGLCSACVCFKRNCRMSSESPGILLLFSNKISPSAGFEKQADGGWFGKILHPSLFKTNCAICRQHDTYFVPPFCSSSEIFCDRLREAAS